MKTVKLGAPSGQLWPLWQLCLAIPRVHFTCRFHCQLSSSFHTTALRVQRFSEPDNLGRLSDGLRHAMIHGRKLACPNRVGEHNEGCDQRNLCYCSQIPAVAPICLICGLSLLSNVHGRVSFRRCTCNCYLYSRSDQTLIPCLLVGETLPFRLGRLAPVLDLGISEARMPHPLEQS